MECLEVKNSSRAKSIIFLCCFRKNLQNGQSLLFFFFFLDRKRLLSCLYGVIFQFYAEKCPEDAEDVEVSELNASPQHHIPSDALIMKLYLTVH